MDALDQSFPSLNEALHLDRDNPEPGQSATTCVSISRASVVLPAPERPSTDTIIGNEPDTSAATTLETASSLDGNMNPSISGVIWSGDFVARLRSA